MADFKLYFPILLKWEGGLADDPNDHGGLTKYGVTLQEWIDDGYDKNKDGHIDGLDLREITEDDAANIAKKYYWDVVKGDQINNQSIAEFICDWAYNSGTKNIVLKLQHLFGLKPDGIVGPDTLNYLNTQPQEELFNQLKQRREQFYNAIVKSDPSQKKFLRGWLIRNNSFIFKP